MVDQNSNRGRHFSHFFASLTSKAMYALAGYIILTLVFMGFVFWYLWSRSNDFTLQSSSVFIAQAMAKKIQPLLDSRATAWEIQKLIDDILVFNPNLDPYILDDTGRIVQIFSKGNSREARSNIRIDPELIKKYFDATSTLQFPIYGFNPSSPKERDVFAVAPLTLHNKPAYLYISLKPEIQKKREAYYTLTNFIQAGTVLIFIYTILAWSLGFLIFYFLTQRFKRIISAVQSISGGDFSQRLAVKGNNELDLLSTSINNMAGRIEQNIEELKRRDKLRRDLIANVSHDLRGPVTLIGGYAESLVEPSKEIKEEKVRDTGGIILRNVNALTRLLMELFELAKLEARETQPDFQPFSITEVIDDIVFRYAPAAELREVRLSKKYPENLPLVLGEVSMIERVLTNLVENALTYTLDGGAIECRLINKGKKIKVEVADTGVGISPEDLPHVFDRFYRAEKWQSRRSSSSGLGLSLVKKIIEAHNTEIIIESEENKGTTFSFELQVAS